MRKDKTYGTLLPDEPEGIPLHVATRHRTPDGVSDSLSISWIDENGESETYLL